MWAWGAQSFPPASSLALPTTPPRLPQPLIAECIVEEVKEDDFVPVEQLIHIYLHIFTRWHLLSQKLRLFKQVRLFVLR